MSEISIAEFKQCLSGFNIIDCAIHSKEYFYIIGSEDYTKWSKSKWDSESEAPPSNDELIKHVIGFSRTNPVGKRMGRASVTGFGRTMIECGKKPIREALAVTLEGDVFSAAAGKNSIENGMRAWDDGGPSRGGIHKLRSIDGVVYFCGGNNSVGTRTGIDSWFGHTHAIANPKRSDGLYNALYDIDGFSEQDVYTAGTDGQVFHFDGKTWKQVAMPTNIELSAVCCAGDDQVYISGRKGTTYMGRGNKWTRIHEGSQTLPFRDMVWHEDRVWCTNDSGVWFIKNDKVERANLPDGIGAYSGNLSSSDGVLLLAGYGGAAFFEHGKWTKIFSVAEMSRSVLE
ncbi:hypothetical protein [Massilia sp. CCM 8734]|uniref:WD40/YVTN/BNR-like repeat-containing protein n=1 Tax=Massilia sp. CCM 8734 TaxID=2609283 RepID=UPI00142341A9|nr:hypothetical protein [Massilia sp. CCM 8734]NIA00895.1 hypothetical protein [Massilia sp. CCM 8734]